MFIFLGLPFPLLFKKAFSEHSAGFHYDIEIKIPQLLKLLVV